MTDEKFKKSKKYDKDSLHQHLDMSKFEDNNKDTFNNEKNNSSFNSPARNILETDNAKYTAEYIKEVVKDLYSNDTKDNADSKRESVSRPVSASRESFFGYDTYGAINAEQLFNDEELSPKNTGQPANELLHEQLKLPDAEFMNKRRAPHINESIDKLLEPPAAKSRYERNDYIIEPNSLLTEKESRQKRLDTSNKKRMHTDQATELRQKSLDSLKGIKPAESTNLLAQNKPINDPIERHERGLQKQSPYTKESVQPELEQKLNSMLDAPNEQDRSFNIKIKEIEKTYKNKQLTIGDGKVWVISEDKKLKNGRLSANRTLYSANGNSNKDAMLKDFEQRVNKEKVAQGRKKKLVRPTGSLKVSYDTARIERVLSGKSDKDDDYAYLRNLPDSNGIGEANGAVLPVPERQKYTNSHDEADKSVADKKIPLVINKNIEGKPKKTSADYINVQKHEAHAERVVKPKQTSLHRKDQIHEPSPDKFIKPKPTANYKKVKIHEAPSEKIVKPVEFAKSRGSVINKKSDDKGRGINIFASVFMVLCVTIIGLLVFKITEFTSDPKDNISEEQVTQMRAGILRLTDENSNLQRQIDQLNNEIERLSNVNGVTSQTSSESENVPQNEIKESEPPQQLVPQEPQSDLENFDRNYYTVEHNDNLYKIAEKYLGNGTLYHQIAEINNINPNSTLKVGQKLIIPKH